MDSHGFQLLPFLLFNYKLFLSLSLLNQFVVGCCTSYCVGPPGTYTRSVPVDIARLEIYFRVHRTSLKTECGLLVHQRYH